MRVLRSLKKSQALLLVIAILASLLFETRVSQVIDARLDDDQANELLVGYNTMFQTNTYSKILETFKLANLAESDLAIAANSFQQGGFQGGRKLMSPQDLASKIAQDLYLAADDTQRKASRQLLMGGSLSSTVTPDSVLIFPPNKPELQQKALFVLAPGAFLTFRQYNELIAQIIAGAEKYEIALYVATIDVDSGLLFSLLGQCPQDKDLQKFVEEANKYIDTLYDLAIKIASDQGFPPLLRPEPDRARSYTNVFAGGHSNGGILMQTARVEESVAGFVHLASLKLFNDRLFNDMTQVAGTLPSLFVQGEFDCLTELPYLLDPAIQFLTLAHTLPMEVAVSILPTVVIPGMNHFQYLDEDQINLPSNLAQGDCRPTSTTRNAHITVGQVVGAFIAANHQFPKPIGVAQSFLITKVKESLRSLNPLAVPFGYGNFNSAFNAARRTYETTLSSLNVARGLAFQGNLNLAELESLTPFQSDLVQDALFNGLPFYKLGIGSSSVSNTYGSGLLASGFASNSGSLQRYIGPPGMFDVAREYCIRVQYLLLLPYLKACPFCNLQVFCLAYTDLVAFHSAKPHVTKIQAGFQVVSHVYLHRVAFQENVCGSLSAPQAPQYWMALATCAQIQACSSPQQIIPGSSLNKAAFDAALASAPTKIQREFEANGIPLGFQRDRLVQFSKFLTFPQAATSITGEEPWRDGFVQAENELKYISEVHVDTKKGVYYLKTLSFAAAIEYVYILGLRDISYDACTASTSSCLTT